MGRSVALGDTLSADNAAPAEARAVAAALAADWPEKLISVSALLICIELVLFKFLPDLSTALLQGSRSALADFAEFQREYLLPGSVHHARFLGNQILYQLAQLVALIDHSTDPRLHPLRVAAGILTPMYAYVGAYVALSSPRLDWRYFMAPYALCVLMGLYVFYPADMPSLACVSLGLYFLLEERLLPALAMMLITGLFRESSLHLVWFVLLWGWTDARVAPRVRFLWLMVFGVAFAAEYVVIRHFFPGPLSSAGGIGIVLDPHELFLGRGVLSLTSICSVGLAVLFPVACLGLIRHGPATDWRGQFFRLNCYAFPAWLVFYRALNGNLSEFRMLFPVLLPCIYGMAYGARWRRLAIGCNRIVTPDA